jgi:predicted HTH transcriptional regulator
VAQVLRNHWHKSNRNIHGGTILLGVDDNSQEIIGIENDIEHYKSEDKFKLAIESKIIDSFQFYDVDKNVQVQLIKINNKTICSINIAPYHEKVLLNEEYIIRKGSQTINHGKNFIN